MTEDRESLDFDVLFVGAGPASLGGAIHLSSLVQKHNEAIDAGKLQGEKLEPTIAIIEKGRELGSHSLSGAVLDPKSLRELLPPDLLNEAPLETSVSGDYVYFLTKNSKFRLPTPPPLRNHGFYVISLGKLVKWLGAVAEKRGIEIFTGFAGSELLYEDRRVVGVRTADFGVDKKGNKKENFQPGMDLRARVTILGEGVRGSLTKTLVNKFRLEGKQPQIYAIGVKELWEVPRGNIKGGTVIHTLGFPLKNDTFGGAFIYALEETLLSIGLVVGLDYKDPYLDPHNEFQRLKTHPFIASLLKGGQLAKYGAKALPEGGYYSIPHLTVDGAIIIGDSGGFLNAQRLKGIHLALKSGMLAAETVFEALVAKDFSENKLATFHQLINQSWVNSELYKVRNFHQGFEHGLWAGLFHAGLQFLTGGRGLKDPMLMKAGHEHMKRIREYYGATANPSIDRVKPDGTLIFDRLTDVHNSATRHEENQPVHLHVHDMNLCATRCREEYGNPCQRFCPAAVYEMVDTDGSGTPRLQINASNCVHCKTCDIMDPYGIIDWVPPEGGGGPNYEIL